MSKTAKHDILTFLTGLLLGIVAVVIFICFKNAWEVKSNCDGVVVSKQWSMDTRDYCVDPSVLEEGK